MTDQQTEAGVVFDVTDIAKYLAHGHTVTGIQRAVLMMIHHAARRAARTGAPMPWLGWRRGGTYHLRPGDALAEMAGFDLPSLGRAMGLPVSAAAGAGGMPPYLRRYARKTLKMQYHVMLGDIAMRRGDEDHFVRRGVSLEDWRAWRAPAANPTAPEGPPWTPLETPGRHPDGGPLQLVVLGAMWNAPEMARMMAEMAAAGAEISLFVHDLIPMVHPEWFDPALPGLMLRWLVDSRGYATRYIANSQSTAADLRRILGPSTPPVAVVPLAQAPVVAPAPAALDDGAGDDDALAARLAEIAPAGDATKAALRMPFALCVGTLETRKNLMRLIQAWLLLAQADPDAPRLVLAGKRGWLNDDVLEAYAATGGFGGRVLWVEGPSDRDLDLLYRRCAFTVCVSLYEGWGLPIGEGLAHGRTGVVSNVTSMPEVGGALVEYCDPASVVSIRDAAARLCDPGHRAALEARIAATPLRGWDAVADDLMAALEA